MNMAIDEAVLKNVSEGLSLPTLRIYAWNPPAVSVGYFQSMEEEVNTEECKKNGFDVVRRVTGGGAVFHDKELTYSIIIREDAGLLSENILESYNQICKGIILGLDKVGIKAEFKPINDIIASGKKISGNAQTRRNHCVLQHGTLLLDVDVEKMFSLLKVPDEKIRDKLIATVKERVTSVNHILEKEVSFIEMSSHIINGFREALNLELVPAELSINELNNAKKLAKLKYSSEQWNLKR